MEVDATQELSEIDSVVSHEHAILVQTALKHDVVRRSSATHVPGRNGVELGRGEAMSKNRRQALVDEELGLAHGYRNRFGRPRRGWARA